METVKTGDTVKVHYTGKLDDGTVFDTSEEGEPLQFTIGEGEVLPGFEQAAIGLKPGESVTVKIPADEAYGPYRNELVIVVKRDQIPADLNPKVGQQLEMPQADEHIVIVTVTDVSESSITLDANHPLARKDLTFEIKLMEIN